MFATGAKTVELTDFGAEAHQQSTDALIAGCGPIYTFPGATERSGTVPAKDRLGIANRQAYPTVVPMFGRFWDDPVPDGRVFWSRTTPHPPVPESLLRNMWDGALVAYYTPEVPAEQVQALRSLATEVPDLGLLVVPWDVRVRGPLPQHRTFALATWNASQSCHQVLVPAVYDFRAAHPADAAPGASGVEPPVLERTAPINVTTP